MKNEYSYEIITSFITLSAYIYQGTNEAKINMILKNNGKKTWPENETKLIYDEKSYFMENEILLQPQKPGEEYRYEIIINNLGACPVGEYKFILSFCVCGKSFGEKLFLRVCIKEHNKKKYEIEENIDKIRDFRNQFNLSIEEHSDENILNALSKNKFDFDKTFSDIFNI